MSNPDPLSWTLFFKKHKTTVLLMLPPHETLQNAKSALLNALQSRGLKELNGDVIPQDAAEVEFGVPVDRNDLEKGWTSLETDDLDLEDEGNSKRASGKRSGNAVSLQNADLRNGQAVAFRFRKPTATSEKTDELDIDLGDPGWDVVTPNFDDEEDQPM
ncbi:hypothetical protein ASPZODRAFT_127349 [Penicilliopsis zonata CBS 506.65]|uniref:Uncharacterized protein n=1 Tax=Penicilliopsis zonata CBS 506.65 TaxID=1073090 RepID=A0A1L9SVQ9_9EURO|nr:hypothetical protein ASPZODRAFT_127349 [Penicilliopsis zonata CBS 506.65]OJJ51292.1 hypothetical protein ASPZODRAFT_127349 [Penicilliopsis zonata CBS 506.65]